MALLLATRSSAEEAVCAPVVAKVPLERHLRQLSLDLLGRPPTIEEYRAYQAKGSISEDDIRQMMSSEEFYARMRGYHRALLRSNISASITYNGDSRLNGTGTEIMDPTTGLFSRYDPYGLTGNTSSALRGANGQTCDLLIKQSECGIGKHPLQDPHADDLVVQNCYDPDLKTVPLPVSFDYDTNFYACTQLDLADKTLDTCAKAKAAGLVTDKYILFCDNRSDKTSDKKLHPFLCKPDPGRSTTAALTTEELNAAGRVVAYVHPNPPAGTPLTRLERCTLDLASKNGLKGTWVPQRGCVQREGVEKKAPPYFPPTGLDNDGKVTVCAIEAQERSANPWTMESCETARFRTDRSCGCGVGLRRCEPQNGHADRVAAINEEPTRIADSVIRNDEPYFNILTTRRSFVNGPLSAFYRQQQGVGVFSITSPANPDLIPDVSYAQTGTWQEYTRDPQHSGVLTTPAFLYRFPTQRARVNEFYEAFLCKTFVPSSDPLPPPEDNCNRENNLAKRCGCNYCHATIEPTGAHWGRFDERNSLFLDPARFPRFDPKCRDCALAGDTNCGGECSQYVMQAYDGDGANSLGMLKTYLYRTAEEEANIQSGPQLLVERMLQTGDLERCAVKRVWAEFLGRPMTSEEQQLYLQQLSEDFAHGNYSLKTLIQKLLMTDAYRRID